ncbi:MAG: membrane bound O-acyl transferase family-domain-containing protein [Candidatus Acidiferrales bacterium]
MNTNVAGSADWRKSPETQIQARCSWLVWAPLAILPAIACVLRSRLEPWQFMWVLAIALFFGCKWQTWTQAQSDGAHAPIGRNLAYLFLWPGMDAATFLNARRPASPVAAKQWIAAAGKTAVGGALIWFVARRAGGSDSLLYGWMGMIGLVMILHFGVFHLIALAWQSLGVNALPIMQSPVASTSLSEFWGKRWNLGFRQLTHGLVFDPLRKRFGLAAGTLAAFFVSGLIHDFVISFPARGGYGLPTGYFLLQGVGVLFERSATGGRIGIQSGFRGWLFVLCCAGAPAFLLFHPLFVQRVMLPFFAFIGELV